MRPRIPTSPIRPLAPYACDPVLSRGRFFPEAASPTRTEFQRDRDRIVHSTAFRRLKHKTQVFVYHEGDHYRTRLTHSIEVSQIARALSRSLMLDEDLAEAVALAHDLGHPPFGHAGERALDRCMAAFGGFDHNAQSVAVVTGLEKRYAAFDGLNLAWESLEGLVKHNGPLLDREGRGLGKFGDRPLAAAIANCPTPCDLMLASHSGAEAQCASIADDVAYNSHDIDDGLRAGLFTIDEVASAVPMIAAIVNEVTALYPRLDPARLQHEVLRRLITGLIEDVLAEAARRIEILSPGSADDVRHAGGQMLGFSDAIAEQVDALRTFLLRHMYRHDRVMGVMQSAEAVVSRLFDAFLEEPASLPPEWRATPDRLDLSGRARAVADYIAGMTDRFALAEHLRLFDAVPELR